MRVVGAGRGSRGQAIQLGALLLFAILIINLSLFQVFVVPDQNSEIEFKHNERVHQQLQDIRSATLRTAGSGTEQGVTVTLGPQYPSRSLFVNPAPPAGTLRTVGTDDSSVSLAVTNAEAVSDEETAEFWDGSEQSYGTGAVSYRPAYNYYDAAPRTVYEQSVLYNRFEDGSSANYINLSQQRLVNSRSLNLLTLAGEYSESGTGAAAVDTQPISASPNRLAISDDGTPIQLTVSTMLPDTVWVDILRSEFDDNAVSGDLTDCEDVSQPTTPADDGRYIVDCSYSAPSGGSEFGTLTLTLEPDTTYSLRASRVGINTRTSRSPDNAAAYITDISGNGENVPEGTDEELVVEVRDEFNNPVTGVEVTATLTNDAPGADTILSPTTTTTDSDGEASFTYSAPDDVDGNQDVNVEVSFDGGGTDSKEVTFDLTVIDSDGSGSGSNTNTGTSTGEALVYEDGSGSALKGIVPSGDTTTYGTSGPQAIGQLAKDYDGDGVLEIPYTDGSSNVKLIDRNGQTQDFFTSSSVKPKTGQSLVVGDINSDGTPELYFVAQGDGLIYSGEFGDSQPAPLTGEQPNSNVGATSLFGIGDYDSGRDAGLELVYVADNGKIAYYNFDDSSTVSINVRPNNPRGVGPPADYDDDNVVEVTYIDGSGNIVLVEANEATQTIMSVNAQVAPMAAFDWRTDTSPPEILFIDGTGTVVYYEVPSGGSQAITDNNGNTVSASTGPGIQ